MMWQEKNWDTCGSLWQGLASTIWGEALRAEPLLAVEGWFQVWEREMASGPAMR